MTDAERIRHLRLTIGMSQRDLAEQSGVDRAFVQRAEAGEQVRQQILDNLLATLERIASEAGVDTSDESTSLEVVIFGVLVDYSSDMDWIDEVGAKLTTALRDSGLLR